MAIVLHLAGGFAQASCWQHDATGNRARESIGNTSKLAWHNTRNQITQIGGGMSLVEGTLDELGTVTVKVNSGTHQPARMTSLPGGGARFQKEAEFQTGTNTIEVKATDVSANQTTQNYTVEVDAISDTFTHDANGNLETHTSGGVTKRHEWDAKNRLLAIQSADPPVNGSTRTEFEYDGLDRRVRTIEKTHNGNDWITQSNVTWLWCGDEICQQRDSTGVTVTRSYYAEGMMDGTTPYLQTTDHLGSPRELLDGTTGALVARYDYDPWGTRTKLAGSGVDSDFSFTGHLLHTVSGLILAKHRAYSPTLGRWISSDPIGEEDDLNLYRYVGGSPTMDVDLLGLRSWAREALGFVPVIGSALDAYDSARCGNYLMAGVSGVMAISEALGVGLIGKGAKLIGKALLKKIGKRANAKLPPSKIYRRGSRTSDNFTPRPKDTGGLSTTIRQPAGKSQVIDPSRLNNLEAVQDGIDHVSVRPKDMRRMQEWINSRGSGTPHEFTLELQNAVIGTTR